MGGLKEDTVEKVKNLVLEMKDTTELMIDLAYSSLIYTNDEIAEEVNYLNEKVALYSLELKTLAIDKVARESRDLTLILIELSSSFKKVAEAAMEIADVILRGLPLHPILKKSIQEGDVGIYKGKISSKSSLAGKALKEVDLASETGIWVFAIRRGDKWIYGPDEDSRLEAGDIIFVRAPDESKKVFLALCSGEKGI